MARLLYYVIFLWCLKISFSTAGVNPSQSCFSSLKSEYPQNSPRAVDGAAFNVWKFQSQWRKNSFSPPLLSGQKTKTRAKGWFNRKRREFSFIGVTDSTKKNNSRSEM